MIKDKALEELFLALPPCFDDDADFMARLTRRLDAVEFVKQHQEASLRRYKMAMVVAFVVGIFSGAVTMVLILSAPANVPLFTFSVHTPFLLWFVDNSRVLVAAALSLLMTSGIMSIIYSVQDIMQMRIRNSSGYLSKSKIID